jgi:hypothetical protein
MISNGGAPRRASVAASRRRVATVWGATTAVVLLCAALVSDGAAGAGASPTSTAPLPGPAATLSPLTGGHGTFLAEPMPVNLHRVGYVEHEYAASGVATSYTAQGGEPHDGDFTFVPATQAPYKTRVIVRYPADPSKFSGTVIVEWLNVSGGADAEPEWKSLHEEITRAGDAWVGVSAQAIGVVGGQILVPVPPIPGYEGIPGKGLRKIDPARYGSLEHPGDGFSYDIFTQAARAVRAGAALGKLRPRHVLAAGESQSAYALVTYYDGVQPLTHEFDGFFVHSRGAEGLPLVGPGRSADLTQAIGGPPVLFRTDQRAPIIDLQSEADVIGVLDSYAARQPDNPRLRLWEVTGTAHADVHLIGPFADRSIHCGVPINNGDMHIVAKAALAALTTWVDTGRAPVHAPRLDVAPGATPTVQRAPDGIALGGIRTPPVTVPVAALSGAPGANPSVICLLLGQTKPFTTAQLHRLYPSRADYLRKYRATMAATINAGFALSGDRNALAGYADPSAIPG